MRWLLLLPLAACALPPGDGRPIDSAHFTQTGGGPSVTPAHDLEFELDYDADPGDRLSTAVGLVYGLPHAAELSLAWSPYAVLDRPGRDSRGAGDVSVATKMLLLEPAPGRPAWSLELGTHLDTGEAGHLDRGGEADLFIATSAAQSWGRHTWMAYYELVQPGRPNDDSVLVGHVGAVQWATPLAGRWVGYVEAIGFTSPAGNESGSALGSGAVWQVHPRIALEAGILVGLGGDSEDFRILLGVSSLLASFAD